MVLKVFVFVLVSYLGYYYVSTQFENDRFFSHLSTLEREMTFRTEAGFYYMFYKIIVEAPTFLQGWQGLVNDTGTEFPSSINTLQRFNVYPEVVLGKMFRVFRGTVEFFNVMRYFKQCYGITRAEGMGQVESCVGPGDLSVFYVNCIFALTGLFVGFLFLLGCHISDNNLGGLLAVSCFFFNHGEATRVQWIPPLRESFSLPFLILQTLLLSQTIRSGTTRTRQVLLVLATFCFTLPWQFSQFVLLTQTLSLFGSYSLRFLKQEQISPVLDQIFVGYVISTICQFFNTMLISSMYVAGYLAFKAVILLDHMVKLSNKMLQFILDVVVFLFIAGLYKAGSAWVLQLSDDAHIFHILLAKFTDYKDFHTMLYTCSKAFDFIEMETFFKLTLTLLLPTTLAVLIRLTYVFGATFLPKPQIQEESVPKHNPKPQKTKKTAAVAEKTVAKEDTWESHAYLTYHMFQFCCYLGMAVILMRLKLFMTPYMCVLAALVANNFVLPQNEKSRLVIVSTFLHCAKITLVTNITGYNKLNVLPLCFTTGTERNFVHSQ